MPKPAVSKAVDIIAVGVGVSKITAATRQTYKVPHNVNGLLVSEISAGGEADIKGVALGDIIVEINQQGVTEPEQMNAIIEQAIKDKKSSILLLINRVGDIRFVALKLDGE